VRPAALALAALLSAAVLAPAGAQGPAPATITVTGEGSVDVAPDEATLSAGVETRADSAEAALAENSERMREVIAALDAAGVPERAIRTSGLSVFPVREGGAGRERAEVESFRAVNTVTVTTGDLDRLGTLMDALVGSGANRLGQLSFGLSDPAEATAEARRAAVAEAVTAAETFAAAAGHALGPLVALDSGGGARPGPHMRALALESSPGVPVAPGETTVTASVTMTWRLAPSAE
jgi:hypothetical protein